MAQDGLKRLKNKISYLLYRLKEDHIKWDQNKRFRGATYLVCGDWKCRSFLAFLIRRSRWFKFLYRYIVAYKIRTRWFFRRTIGKIPRFKVHIEKSKRYPKDSEDRNFLWAPNFIYEEKLKGIYEGKKTPRKINGG